MKYPCADCDNNPNCYGEGHTGHCMMYIQWRDNDEEGVDEIMGQYFLLVNKTKKQYLYGNTFGDGIKGHEILWNGTMLKALGFLLMKSDSGDDYDLFQNPMCGYWAGDEIVIIGDYDSSKLYTEANATYRDISTTVINSMLSLDNTELYFPYGDQVTDMRKRIKEYPPIPFDELSNEGRQKHDPKIKIPENDLSFDPT
jgi:hypothetical protein